LGSGSEGLARARLRRRSIGAALAFAAVGLLLTAWLTGPRPAIPVASVEITPLPAAEIPPPILPAAPPEPAPPARSLRVVEGKLGRGQTLGTALGVHGISAQVVHTIATEMSPAFDFRYSRPGDGFRLIQREDGELVEFLYTPSELVSYHLVREGEGFETQRWEAEQHRQTARIAGIITSSLYEAITQLGEHPQLASDFAEIFAWDVDFAHAVQAGDEFSILYERLYRVLPDGRELYEGPGRILAARYGGVEGDHRAVYFEAEEGRGGYYGPDGNSVQRQFLRAPLSFSRISSGYTLSRLHPVLKVRRPHQGVDYAAPTGTPVWSVADGRVVFRGWQGGFGNLVKVRHPNGYETWYGHLSRFARGLHVGQTVGQKQIVGYVGSTGLATGPHLDFRMKRNGNYVNPSRLATPAGPPIPSNSRTVFRAACDRMLAQLDPQPLAVTNEAL
jgi:murein DD-endopeptidase MepM/ murein hydrolase activator NlpD